MISQNSKKKLMKKKNVVGVGKGYKISGEEVIPEDTVTVLVEKKVPLAMLSAHDVVPKTMSGYLTDVVEVGRLKALQIDRTARHRPAMGGISIGHEDITAGTFGCVVFDKDSGDMLILSNNHVLANSNDANFGDPILQPGPYDGGTQVDVIAYLERFMPINFGETPATCQTAEKVAEVVNLMARAVGSSHSVKAVKQASFTNYIDAAVARPIMVSEIRKDILEIGVPAIGILEPYLYQKTRKSGRTTGFTEADVTVLSATVQIDYGKDEPVTFEDQVVLGPMSAGGDSGSLIVDSETFKPTALLYAGSSQATIACKLSYVENLLGVSFDPV